MRIDPQERAYREAVMRDIKRSVAKYGRHVARPHADRARQFMPFAALKGYHELAHSQEATRIPRPELPEERLAELSEALQSLNPGDDVRVSFYEGGQRITLRGPLSKVDEVAHSVSIGVKRIPLASILDIEPTSS
ncbi:YolD-like family protein [Slackia equolifaciens]|nr:YolD-like family protein [Slackia equolifaciens]